MQQQIIIRKGFGLPGRVQGIAGDGFAVHTDIQVLSFGSVTGTGIIPQPAFNTPSFIIIGAGAFGIKITAHLKSVHKELTHIVSYLIKIFNQFG